MRSDEGKKGPGRTKLHRAGEDYLKTILALQMAYGGVHSADVAKELNVSKASVWKTITPVPVNRPEAMATCSKSIRNPDSGNGRSDSLVDRILDNLREENGIT